MRTGRLTRSASIGWALGFAPFREVLESRQVEIDPLLYPVRALAGLFQALAVVAELQANLGPALVAGLEERGARLGVTQLLWKLPGRHVLGLAADFESHARPAFLGPLRPLFTGLFRRDSYLNRAFGHGHCCRHFLTSCERPGTS